MKQNYPFKPKSTSYLKRGQFWSVPLENGKYCCGVVVGKLSTLDKVDSRMFIAALLDWVGDTPPTIDLVAGSRILEQSYAHIKTIQETGGEILGEGFKTSSEQEVYPKAYDMGAWGYHYILALATKTYGR
ncbi:Imm26 family immunity protein [Motilimonas eburnea]|uniref:Imm26 family immunity protein n=1 Tax=Motilimonas eburnea TaxID=1737488 RepID=UPI001E2D19B8|nr:Imm26 family immunity protein [Motilimonas eburnea]MCE2570054.1 immunity 26/phosphotriesterase HocA family protein [Motilimonas eburnea]